MGWDPSWEYELLHGADATGAWTTLTREPREVPGQESAADQWPGFAGSQDRLVAIAKKDLDVAASLLSLGWER